MMAIDIPAKIMKKMLYSPEVTAQSPFHREILKSILLYPENSAIQNASGDISATKKFTLVTPRNVSTNIENCNGESHIKKEIQPHCSIPSNAFYCSK